MPKLVYNGAQLKCRMGNAPAKLTVLPAGHLILEKQPLATLDDYSPFVNIAPFGMCRSTANPQVAAATAAANGALTPQPCSPATARWIAGGATMKIGSSETLDDKGKCVCQWGGIIEIDPTVPLPPAFVPLVPPGPIPPASWPSGAAAPAPGAAGPGSSSDRSPKPDPIVGALTGKPPQPWEIPLNPEKSAEQKSLDKAAGPKGEMKGPVLGGNTDGSGLKALGFIPLGKKK